jgi:hypothetical protein
VYPALVISLFIGFSAYAQEGPQVEFFSPQGTVKTVRQVTARFSEQMVPFGDPRGLIEPFEIACPEKGTSRWGDGKNRVFDFDKDLPAGIRCEFRSKPGLKTLSGKEVAAIPWTPEAGKYSLAIADGDENILDYVCFEVRGPEADRDSLSEDVEGTFTN